MTPDALLRALPPLPEAVARAAAALERLRLAMDENPLAVLQARRGADGTLTLECPWLVPALMPGARERTARLVLFPGTPEELDPDVRADIRLVGGNATRCHAVIFSDLPKRATGNPVLVRRALALGGAAGADAVGALVSLHDLLHLLDAAADGDGFAPALDAQEVRAAVDARAAVARRCAAVAALCARIPASEALDALGRASIGVRAYFASRPGEAFEGLGPEARALVGRDMSAAVAALLAAPPPAGSPDPLIPRGGGRGDLALALLRFHGPLAVALGMAGLAIASIVAVVAQF